MTRIQEVPDLTDALQKIRDDLEKIRRTEFDLKPVTELSAIRRLSFPIELKDQLEECGALDLKLKTIGWEYGYMRTNESNAKVTNALYAADNLLLDVCKQLADYHLLRRREFTEIERSRFTVIIGGMGRSGLVHALKGDML